LRNAHPARRLRPVRFAGFIVVPLVLAGAALMAVRSRIPIPLPSAIARPAPVPEEPLDPPPAPEPLPDELVKRLAPRLLGGASAPLRPQAIVLHSTSGLSLDRAIVEMKKRALSVHVLIDTDGAAYQLVPFDRRARAARAMDDVAIHLSIVAGVNDATEAQVASCAEIAGLLVRHYRIFASNENVITRAGVFSHTQVKYRFGGLRRGETESGWEPGEPFVQAILTRIGGTFFHEEKWYARSADGWCVMQATRRAVAKATKGRDLTPPARVELRCCESENGMQPDSFRQKYIDRGRMPEIRGIVLHFTYTGTLADAIQAWENDGFGPHIIVDVDGKAYQIVDSLRDVVAAAGGTNETCVQIEIVGMGQKSLLANEPQVAKVVELLKELAAAHRIPLTNADIDDCRGVFSHGQAKKRWGRSRTLTGTDFDPGEGFMKRVLDAAGGTYVPEEKWKGRSGGEWTIELDEWIP